MISAYTKIFLRKLGDYDHPRTREITLTRYDGQKVTGVVGGLIVQLKPREVFKKDGTRLTKRELKQLEGV